MIDREDVGLLRAKCHLDMVSTDELRAFALEKLTEPVDEALLELVLCEPGDDEGVRRCAEKLFRRHGAFEISDEDAVRLYARHVSSSILQRKVAPADGAALIAAVRYRLDLPGFHELDTFVYASSELDDRPEDPEFFDKVILAEAHRWVGGAGAGPG